MITETNEPPKGICKHCQKPIEYIGQHWLHSETGARDHVAEPRFTYSPEQIKTKLAAWYSECQSKHIDAFFCITSEPREGGPPLVTVTIIPDGDFTKEQIDRARAHLEGIAELLKERAQPKGEQ